MVVEGKLREGKPLLKPLVETNAERGEVMRRRAIEALDADKARYETKSHDAEAARQVRAGMACKGQRWLAMTTAAGSQESKARTAEVEEIEHVTLARREVHPPRQAQAHKRRRMPDRRERRSEREPHGKSGHDGWVMAARCG